MSGAAGTSLRARKPRRLNSHINVVPYIDVMLVLLVIFMVTAPLMAPAVVDLPKVAAATTSAANALAIEIVVQKDGRLKLSDRDPARAAELAVSTQDVAAQAKARMRVGEDRPVVIAADKGVIYEQVLNVMGALKSGGVARVGLSVLPSGASQ